MTTHSACYEAVKYDNQSHTFSNKERKFFFMEPKIDEQGYSSHIACTFYSYYHADRKEN